MSRIEDTVNTLENKIDKLLNRFEVLKKENQTLVNDLQEFQLKLNKQEAETTHWKSQFESLKVASAMLGSDENKRETKLKINALIREIDHCIGQLSE